MNRYDATPPDLTLSIGALAERTGVPTATLRSWESRYGFPTSSRLEGGHRRYRSDQVALIEQVLALRQQGVGMRRAIQEARTIEEPPERSFFAALDSGEPGLRSHMLRKPVLSALTSALEDECMAQAKAPVLLGAFQQARHFRASEVRWHELSRTAAGAAVFADFAGSDSARAGRLAEVHLEEDSPVRREWALVCDGPGFAATVVGWEHPSPEGTPDQDRRFETIWSVDPTVVRRATKVGLSLVGAGDPELSRHLERSLPVVDDRWSPQLQRASSLFGRVLDYLQQAS